MSKEKEYLHVIEAALFSSERPLNCKELQRLFSDDLSTSKIKLIIDEISNDYQDRGIELVEVAGGFRFQTRTIYASNLRLIQDYRPPRYSRALLETLAIIAYRQPVTRGDIEEIRGVTVTTEIMRALLDREWVKQSGSRDVPGHPALFVTTHRFLEYFGLESIKELPNLQDERQLADIAKDLGIQIPQSDLNQQTGSNQNSNPSSISVELVVSDNSDKSLIKKSS